MGKTDFKLAAVVLCLASSLICSESAIADGVLTSIDAHPWQASILNSKGDHTCGGAIINKRFILTAAQCLHGNPCSVRTGSTLVNQDGTATLIKRTIAHELFNKETLDYDIGLIQLKHSLAFDAQTAPIPLSKRIREYKAGTEVQIAGWETGKGEQEHLQEIKISTILRDECKETYSDEGMLISVRQNCARDPEGGQSACEGDTGGAVVEKNHLIGIFSWGFGCIDPEFPAVYTDIKTLRSWVDEYAF